MKKYLPILKKIISPRHRYIVATVLDLILIAAIVGFGIKPAKDLIQPLVSPLHPLNSSKSEHEVFGFLPFWNLNKTSNIDFNVLTTMAYFGVPILSDGNLDKEDKGYEDFKSKEATDLFKRAHQSGTRVVLTITQMENDTILAFLDNEGAKEIAISQTVDEVSRRGIDGVNVDFEYIGNPGSDYREKFSKFVSNLTNRMHSAVPQSRVTVSVYASAVKDPKIYDIASLGQSADAIFMMAYDFATYGADLAIPTAPLYGYKEGKYWYDIATSVDDFLKFMDPNKLILGVPWYGYNYLVYEPGVKAETRPRYSWRGKPSAQPYASAKKISLDSENIDDYKTGWDDFGKVSYIAYHVVDTDTWRMIFLDDEKSLKYKYQFAKDKNLLGVGMWALGFEEGRDELWRQLSEEFGNRLADQRIVNKGIYDTN